MCPHHRNGEATNYLSLINRSQQDYFLDHSSFASFLENLQLGNKTETNYYSYKIFQTSSEATYAYAVSKDEGLYSYIGAVFITTTSLGEKTTVSIVCGLDQPGLAKIALPLLDEYQQPVCAKKGSWKLGERSTARKYQQKLWRWGR